MPIFKLKPAFKDYLWGNDKLKTNFHKQSNLEIIAESWELSCHKDGLSIIDSGEYQGISFRDFVLQSNEKILGTNYQKYQDFPILIKFIDSKQALSIQVHPDDEYALKHEQEFGKNEMWYILDHQEDAYLYYGVNQEISKEEFKKRIEDKSICEVLNKVKVKKGDVFFIKAGTIHAIGEGITILEIQQNSNSTYRVYDFDRKDANGNTRPLHINKAIDVSNLKPLAISNQKKTINVNDNSLSILNKSEYFNTYLYEIKKELSLSSDETSFHSLIVTEGSGVIISEKEELRLLKGDSIFISANSNYQIKGELKVVLTTI